MHAGGRKPKKHGSTDCRPFSGTAPSYKRSTQRVHPLTICRSIAWNTTRVPPKGRGDSNQRVAGLLISSPASRPEKFRDIFHGSSAFVQKLLTTGVALVSRRLPDPIPFLRSRHSRRDISVRPNLARVFGSSSDSGTLTTAGRQDAGVPLCISNNFI